MVKDKKSNVMIESASQTNNVRTIEGYRWLDNCNDEREDIYLRGDSRYKIQSGSASCFS